MNEITKKILEDEQVKSKYEQIDKVNPYPFSHGLKHIYSVIELADRIAKIFKLGERETLMLEVAEALHDLGQVDGREKHGEKAAKFAEPYLKDQGLFSQEEISQICEAITTHDSLQYEKSDNKFSWFVAFVDKMDFSKKRLEDNSRERFGRVIYDDIEDVDFAVHDNEFTIFIRPVDNPQIINEETIYSRSREFMRIMTETALGFCNHFGFNLKIKLGDKDLDYMSHIQNKDGKTAVQKSAK